MACLKGLVACASLRAWLDMLLNRHSYTAECREPSRLCAASLGGLVPQRQVHRRLKALLRLKALFRPFYGHVPQGQVPIKA